MKLARPNAIISMLADDDLTGKAGHFVRMSSNTAIALIDNALTPPLGLLLTEGKTNERVSVAISAGGLAGTVRVKLAGTVQLGGALQLTADGRVVSYDSEFPRMIVGVALESGVIGELIEVALQTPTYTPAS